ncbi:Zinc finger protein CONSTANS-LIKE 4 [Nymphaea thermarum]|nr:Zinc finger protein CONSTANS-LIKE 4 [Nymphaea thermarum]
MLQEVIRPPEPHSPDDLSVVSTVLFDFGVDDVLFAEALRNPPEVSTSSCSDDTCFSSSSPSAPRHQNPCVADLTPPPPRQQQNFPPAFLPALPLNDQFDLSPLQPFSNSSPYGDNAAGPALSYALPAPIGFESSPPMPCVFGPPFEAEEECLSPFADFVQAAALAPVFHGGMSTSIPVDQGRAFSAGSVHLIPVEPAPTLELHPVRNGGVFAAGAVRRVYSAGDIQGLHHDQKQQLVGGACGGTPRSDSAAPLEDSAFKVGRYSVEERKQRIHRYLKKRNERNFNKKIKYACRKTLADSRPRVRGRFAKNDDFNEGTVPNSRRHYDDDEEEVDNIAEGKEQDLVDSSDIFAHISGVNAFNTNFPIQSWT